MSNTGTWRILYHAGEFKGRAEFIRLILEDAGVEYTESAENLYGPEGICDAFRAVGSGADGLVAGANLDSVASDTATWPVMFPPIIHHVPAEAGEDEVFVNQVPTIMRYCAARLGYLPEGPAQTAKADQITQNANDFIAEGRKCFHPVDDKRGYKEQKEEADVAAAAFASGRMCVWLGHFEKIVCRLCPAGEEPKPLLGKMTYADFVLFHVLDAAEAQFPDAWAGATVPKLKSWKAGIAARPNLQKYFASSRCKPWAGDSMM
eukprot:gnl/TRDRNA2_/TRDRNA2_158082_c0_seq1.p1 gnl/TRDRNA2_/TRDRNA2_158082_c0~~gnl/TRDRNA2_/TRDRNA2_158082_c0_seq1.p1  ORF type:complete len:262 (-),score=49.32 gnl/TRDRNA2_/TRDRNA2_158082_c0_seq1:51-836(-)